MPNVLRSIIDRLVDLTDWPTSPSSGQLLGWNGSAPAWYTPQIVRLGQTVVGAGGSASVTFSSIPATYSALEVQVVARGSTAAVELALHIQFNGDTGSSYDWQQINSAGTATPTADAALAQTAGRVGIISGANATSGLVGHATIRINNYAGTTFHKVATSPGGSKANQSAVTDLRSWLIQTFWRSTSAITSVTILPQSGNFVQGSTFTLYGIL